MSLDEVPCTAPQCPTPPAHIIVIAGTDIPSHGTAGPYPTDIPIGLHTSDTHRLGLALEVVYNEGRVIVLNDVTNQWLLHMQPARDRHEQNVETYRDVNSRLCVRFLRPINKGEQLLVWYSDDLARQSGIPILTPGNIRGNQQYMCTDCKKTFLYPNSLKAHIRFRCKVSASDITDNMRTASMFSVRSMFSLPVTGDVASAPVGAVLADRGQSGPSEESIQNWLLRRVSAKKHSSSGFSAFTPNNKAFGGMEMELGTCPGAKVRLTDDGALNLSVREVSSQPTSQSSMSGISQPIQIFNHIHPPAFPITIDHSAIRLYYPYVSPLHDQTRVYCGSLPNHTSLGEQRDCIPQYGRHLLMTAPKAKIPEQELSTQCFQTQFTDTLSGKNSSSSIPFPFPMPSETEGEPLDLIPRSLLTSKSRKGHLCIYCGKLYSRKYGLKIHLRTHTGYKPLKCKVCLRPFGDPSNLNKHVRLHAEGDTPYRCEFCGKVLVRRRDLERHVKSRHPDEAEKHGKEVGAEDVEQADTTTADSADTTDREIIVT